MGQTVPLALKGQEHSGENVIILSFVSTYTAKTGEDFGAQSGSKSARMAKLWQFLQSHPKPAFSFKMQRGDQGKFLKNRPKSSLRFKGPKAHWCKWYYPLICTRLKCKQWHFGANSGSKSARMARLWQFSRGHSKPAFSEKVQRGTKGNFSKIVQNVNLV